MLPNDPTAVTADSGKHTHTAQCLAQLARWATNADQEARAATNVQWAVFHELLMAGTPMPDLIKHFVYDPNDPDDVEYHLKDYRRWLDKTKWRERHYHGDAHSHAQRYLNNHA